MAETRSKTARKENADRAAEESVNSRIDEMIGRTDALEATMASQNAKIDASIAEMNKTIGDVFEAIRLLSTNKETSTGFVPVVNPVQQEPARVARSGSTSNYSGMTRLAKINFPKFNGEKVVEWLFNVEQFFDLDNTPEELKVKLASMHLEGIAATWHQSVVQSEMLGDRRLFWPQYMLMLKERFEEVLDDPMAELKDLRESSGIVEYHSQFEMIRTRVSLPEHYLVSVYLAGLRVDTQMHVRMFQPQTVRHCLLLGRLYEKAHPQQQPGVGGFQSSGNTLSHNGRGILPLPSNTSDRGESSNSVPQRFLTNEEMSERRSKGLCYYCDEKYTPGHWMKHKKKQLFLMEVNDDANQEAIDVDTTEYPAGR